MNIFQQLQALTIASCEDSESLSSSVQESLTSSFQSCSSVHFNASALQKLSLYVRPQNLTWENSLNFLIVLYFFLFSPSPCTLYFYSLGLTSFLLLSFFLICCSFIRTQAQSLFKDWVGEGNTWSKTCISSLCCKDWVGAPAPDQNHWVTIFWAMEDRVGEAISWSKIVRCTRILVLVKALAGFCKGTGRRPRKAEPG